MAEKHLTEQGWNAVAKKHKIDDSALEKALAKFEQLDEDNFDKRLDALGDIKKHASAAKSKNKSTKEVVAYLDDVVKEAEKTRRALELEQKAAEEEDDEDDEGEDETDGDLVKALARVRTGTELQFCACVGNPFAVALARRVGGKQRRALKAINNGSAFLRGTCVFEANAHTFVVPRVKSGLAKKLKRALALQTGKMYKVRVRGQEDGQVLDDETDIDTDAASEVSGNQARVTNFTTWTRARTGVVDKLRGVARQIATVQHPQTKGAILELNAVMRQLTPEPGTQAQISALETYLTQDKVVADVCDLDFDMRDPLLAALAVLKQQVAR